MKRQFMAYFTVILILVSMVSGMVLPASAATVTYAKNMTDQSAAGTYYVADASDLAQLAVLVNAGMSMSGYTFLQTKDINLSGVSYTPIGDYNTSVAFKGVYDGQRHVIKNLTYYDEARNGAGVFGYLYGATIKNLGVESGSVTAANRAGGIAGYADGSEIINCYNKASITILSGTDGVGGIAGVARSSANFYGCYNAGTITCNTTGAGGILGWAGKGDNSMLVGCYNAGPLKHTGELGNYYSLDMIARNTLRTAGDFSSCYYLAGCYVDAEGTDLSDTYNGHEAIRLEQEDATLMAYVLNHATGANTNAFTVKDGKIAFSSGETDGVIDLRIKAYADGVLLKDTGVVRTIACGYTVPDEYENYAVLGATSGGESYGVGSFISSDTADVLTVELQLEGDYPSVSDYESNKDATIFTVSSAKELADLADLVDAGNTFAGKSVYVTADLDFSAYNTWNGIGLSKGSGGGSVNEGSLPFSGIFDGQFHHFKNINFRQSATYSGIFSYAGDATIRDIILDEGTVHCVGATGRLSGVLVAVASNTLVENIENHVSVYAEQEEIKANNLGMVALPLDGSVINSCVNYGEVGLAGKTNLQDNGSFAGWGYNEATVKNCIAVGMVHGENSNPIARGCTLKNNYYLPHGETAGTLTYEKLFSGEAAYLLNNLTGQQVWSKGEEGPTLDPDHPVKKAEYTIYETNDLLSGVQAVYYNAGKDVSLPVFEGFKTLNESNEFWPLTNTYTGPHYDHALNAFYAHNTYTITYVLNGGRFVNDPATTKISGVAAALPTINDIQRDGYAFTGWYTNPELTGDPVTETPIDLYHTVSYYAGWKALTKITTAKQLAAMTADGAYILAADINMTGVSFAPIGTYEKPFTGHFDGDGYVISGLTIDSKENYQGLFGVNEGFIRNVILDDDCTINGNAYVGGIAGENLGMIENCISRAKVAGASDQKTISFTLLVQNMRIANPIPQERQTAMKERMDTCDADLMLLQEANTPWITFLEENYVNTGKYGLLYKYRSVNSSESVPVMYKKSKFELIESGHFWLSDTPDVESAPEGYKHYRICTWAVLKDKTTAKYVIAFSVHLDTAGDVVRSANAQAMKKRFDEVRSKYASYDPVCIIAGDFNCPAGSSPYNILASDDMVNTIYEITPALTPARIDHILISENNVRASDATFEYLPIIDAEKEIPSDHMGLYVKMLGLVKSRIGGIAGSNSGTIKNSVGTGTVGGSYNYGTLTGRNMATVEGSYYKAQSGVSPLGNSVEITEPTAITSNEQTVYDLNQAAAVDRYTIDSGEIALVGSGEAPACVSGTTTNASHSYGKATTVKATCIAEGYTKQTCSVCGYEKRTNLTAALGHTLGQITPFSDNYHMQTCSTCKKNFYADHILTAQTLEATCESYGGVRYLCECGYYYDEITTDKLSHIWEDFDQLNEANHQQLCRRDNTHVLEKSHTLTTTLVEATCEKAGGTTYDCADCGYHNYVESGEPAGHSYGNWQPYDEENHQAICERDANHVIYAPHALKAVSVVAPTCEEKGYTRYVCEDCGHTYDTDFVEATGHEFQYDAEAKHYICHCGTVYVTTGDLDGDGNATTADVILLLRRIDGWQGEIPDYAADINGDGAVKIFDAVRFLQILNS